MIIFISYILTIISGLSEGIMDTLQFHFDKSSFPKLKNQIFWDPKISWKNKWKNGDPLMGERFRFSSTLFVFSTDAWHFFKFLRNTLIFISLSLGAFYINDFYCLILFACISRIMYGVGFMISYR